MSTSIGENRRFKHEFKQLPLSDHWQRWENTEEKSTCSVNGSLKSECSHVEEKKLTCTYLTAQKLTPNIQITSIWELKVLEETIHRQHLLKTQLQEGHFEQDVICSGIKDSNSKVGHHRTKTLPRMVVLDFNLNTQEAKADECEFNASLAYEVSCRPFCKERPCLQK